MYGVAAVEAGVQSPVIGASGEVDGFRRIARQTNMAGAGEVPTAGRQVPMGVGEAMEVGKDPTAVGLIMATAGSLHSRNMRSLGYLGRGFLDDRRPLYRGALCVIGCWSSSGLPVPAICPHYAHRGS
jgi:hypothetical protein